MAMTRLKNLSGWTMCAVLLTSPCVISNSLVDYANLPQGVFIQTAALALLVLASVRVALEGEVRIRGSALTCTVILFLLWVLISLGWSRNRYEGFLVFLHLMSCGIVFLVVSSLADVTAWPRRIIISIVGMAAGVALLGCAQQILKITWIPQQVPPAATFGNRNVASHLVSMVFPIVPVLFFLPWPRRLRPPIRIGASLVALLLLAYLFFTETRAAWLACIVSGVFLIIAFARDAVAEDSLIRVDKRMTLQIVLLTVSTVIVLAVFAPKPIQHLVSISKQKYMDSINRRASVDIRVKMWRNGLEMFKDRPIAGFGVGNFKVFYPLYHARAAIDPAFSEQKRPLNIHNDFFQAAIELGSVGLLLFAGLVAFSLFMAFRLLRQDQPPEVRLISIGVGSGILAMVITSMFSFPMQRSLPPLILFTYMGILVGLYHHQTPGKRTISTRVPRAVAVFVCVPTVATAVMITQFNHGLLASDAHYQQSLRMARIGAWPEAIDSGLKSYEINPHKMAALEAVGWAQVELNELDKGIETLGQVLRDYPFNIKAMGKLGDAYYKGGDYRKAFEIFEKLVAIKGDSPSVLARMGNICIKGERYSDALGYFEQAVSHDQENPLLHTNLGFVKFKLGKYSEAAKEYEKVLTYRPDMLYAHMSLASIYDSYMKEPDKASYHLRRCVEIGGDVDIREPDSLQGGEK
ncbi:MAG: O-antigen ligase family protein [Thermodesulfobacteriota bacterium]|nr:O-antigen ligase family protein [Thermodesulfobacteriota bacterium]